MRPSHLEAVYFNDPFAISVRKDRTVNGPNNTAISSTNIISSSSRHSLGCGRFRARARGSRRGILIAPTAQLANLGCNRVSPSWIRNAAGRGSLEGRKAPDRKSGYDGDQ
jgi:hypothetical protein